VGGAIARRLALEGAAVIVNGRRVEPTQACANAIVEAGGRAAVLVGDALRREVCDEMVALACRRFGSVDIVVNNIGGRATASFLDMTEEQWDVAFELNLKGAFFLSQAAARKMIAAGRGGRIITISSVGLKGVINGASYASAKGALLSMTRTLAVELGTHAITVNCVVSGQLDTQKSAPVIAKTRERLIERVPLRRLGRPEDIAGAVAFFASPDAEYVTGEALYVAGGRIATDIDLVPR
jgi:NAD(P)-dependent dehydrogenase (short-subunit alcohol dehydrogenase family)